MKKRTRKIVNEEDNIDWNEFHVDEKTAEIVRNE